VADDNNPIRRRNFLMGAGTAVAVSLAPPVAAEAQTAPGAASTPPDVEPLLTLTATEHAFFVAAADTLIPADDLSPSGSQCGVATFIDRQLAGAYGGGARLYRDGPFTKAKPELGYQLPLNPREFFRARMPPPTSGRAKPTARISTASPTPTAKRRSRPWKAARRNFPASLAACSSTRCST